MNKDQFLIELGWHLKKLPQAERQDILGDIEEFFRYAEKSGDSPEAICARLGDPKKMAKEYLAQSWIASANERKSARSMLKAFFYVCGLGAVNTLYAICVVAVGYIAISAFYIAAVAIGLAGLAAFVSAIATLFGIGSMMWAAIFTSCAVICIGILFFIGTMSLTKLFRRANMAFLNKTSIKMKEEGVNL